MKNKSIFQPLRPSLVVLLMVSGSLTCLNKAVAGDGPTMDQELFAEYKKTHRTDTPYFEKYAKAMHCLEHGQYKTTVKLLKELAKEDPKWPGIWVSLGTADLWLEDYQSGIEATTRAIALRPKDCDMYRRRALHYVGQMKNKEAVADLDKGFKLTPTDDEILELRAKCLIALKRYPEAVADYDRILKVSPKREEILHSKVRLFMETKDWKNAVLTLDKVFAYYPTDETTLLDRARCKMQLKDYKGAVKDYTKAIAMGTEQQDFVLSQRALAYEKLGMQKEAERDKAHSNGKYK